MVEPKSLGKYEISEEIGHGSYGVVYRALDTKLDVPIALKVLRPQLLVDQDFVRRFQREARILARLRHNNIVRVYEVDEVAGNLYIAMELARGPSLAAAIEKGGRASWQEMLDVVGPVCNALDYAHRQGVVHRDLKPSNILLDDEYGPMLVDFGIARLAGTSSMSLTMTGGIVGTPAYIAPEVWNEGRAEPPVDIYALGCIVYEMLTGEVLFGGSVVMQILAAHHSGPQFPAQWPEGVPGELESILSKALAREPESRFASAGEMMEALKQVVRQSAVDKALPTILSTTKPFEPEMILIPAGEFLMGSDPEKDEHADVHEMPQHPLYLPDYYIAKTPVTNAQYRAFVQAIGQSGPPPEAKGDHPVVNVFWREAVDFCRWLSEVTGRMYRLPSEAEWEKAARGPDGYIYPWGNEWDASRCNTEEDGKGCTTRVGAYPQGISPYGCLDMAGNVWEWTRSLWRRYTKGPLFRYPYNPSDGRENLEAGSSGYRVLRGGAFFDGSMLARCAYRSWVPPDERIRDNGFRVCVVAQQE